MMIQIMCLISAHVPVVSTASLWCKNLRQIAMESFVPLGVSVLGGIPNICVAIPIPWVTMG